MIADDQRRAGRRSRSDAAGVTPPARLSVTHLTVAYGERPAVWDVTWMRRPA